MPARRHVSSPVPARIRAEQANAWIAKWQSRAPALVLAALGGDGLTVHAVPCGTRMFTLRWTGAAVIVNQAGATEEEYCFHDVQSAFVFLDALLLHSVSRVETVLARDAVPRPAPAFG